MEGPFACRVCLATDVKLYYMYENDLKTAYENLTGVDLIADNLPQYLCTYCSALVTKCVSFKARCLRSQKLLKYAMENHELTTDYIRTIDRVSHQISLPYTVVPTYNEPEQIETDNIKEESIFDSDIIIFKIEDNEISDDEPLAKKVKKKKKIKKNTAIKQEYNDIDVVDNQIDSFDDITAMNGVEIDSVTEKEIDMVVLTKQQQLEEVLARKNTYNYQNSFYKCDKCYKGFVTDVTYKNHMIRHDVSSGPEMCEICHTRWPDARSLRAHISTSHERKYTCRLCEHTCKSGHKAKEHVRWHSGHKFVCKVCGSCFAKSTSYLTHLRLRHPSEHSCGECGERFISRSGLSMHAKKAHRGEQKSSITAQYKCALCDFKFKSLDALSKHTTYSGHGTCDTHQSPCNHCGENFSSSEVLKDHQKIHHRSVEVRCEECDRTFAHERSFSVHYQRVHLGIKAKYKTADGRRQAAVVCEICGKKCINSGRYLKKLSRGVIYEAGFWDDHTFQMTVDKDDNAIFIDENTRAVYRLTDGQLVEIGAVGDWTNRPLFDRDNNMSKATLVYHQRTHTGEKPFQCTECPKSFSVFQRLKIHTRTHTGERPFKCIRCPKAFKHKAALNRHDRVHTGAKPYACTHCGKAFSQSNSMKLHVRTVHLKIPAPYKSRRNKPNE